MTGKSTGKKQVFLITSFLKPKLYITLDLFKIYQVFVEIKPVLFPTWRPRFSSSFVFRVLFA